MSSGKRKPYSAAKWAVILALLLGSFFYFTTVYLSPRNWQGYQEAGTLEYNLRNYPQAEEEFRAALMEAEKYPKNSPRLRQTLNNLTEVYRIQGKWGEVESTLLRIISIDEKYLGKDHPNVAASLLNLAETYRIQNKTKQADASYRHAIAIAKKSLGPENALYLHFQDQYQDFLRDQETLPKKEG